MKRYEKFNFNETCPEGSQPSGGRCKRADNSGYLKGKCDKGFIWDKVYDKCIRMAKEEVEMKEFAELSNEDSFIQHSEEGIVNYFKDNQLYKYGGNGPLMAIQGYAKVNKVSLKDLDLNYIVDSIYWN